MNYYNFKIGIKKVYILWTKVSIRHFIFLVKYLIKSTIYISSFSFRAVCTNAYDFFVYYDNPRCEKTLRFPIFFQYFLFFSWKYWPYLSFSDNTSSALSFDITLKRKCGFFIYADEQLSLRGCTRKMRLRRNNERKSR